MTRAGGARDAGSIALEFTLVAPALLLLLAFLLACARYTSAGATLDAGVRDAARAATTSRSADAQQRATAVVRGALAPGACADSLVVDPLPEFVAGRPVTVTARCTVPVGDLGLPGCPGTSPSPARSRRRWTPTGSCREAPEGSLRGHLRVTWEATAARSPRPCPCWRWSCSCWPGSSSTRAGS